MEMKKLSMKAKSLSVLILLAASMIVPLALAKGPGSGKGLQKGKDKEKHLQAAFNGLNKDKGAMHLYLYEKNETWGIVEGGSWGKITYIPHRDKFIFNGHGLEPDVMYDLINYAPGTDWGEDPYPEPWPGVSSTEIASGSTNEDGNIHLKGSWSENIEGKVWLVDSDDFDLGTGMTGWTPTEYLFEYDLLPQ